MFSRGLPAGHERQLAVVHPVGQDDQPQGDVLVFDLPHASPADHPHTVEKCAVPARVQLSEMRCQPVEVVEDYSLGRGSVTLHAFVGARRR